MSILCCQKAYRILQNLQKMLKLENCTFHRGRLPLLWTSNKWIKYSRIGKISGCQLWNIMMRIVVIMMRIVGVMTLIVVFMMRNENHRYYDINCCYHDENCRYHGVNCRYVIMMRIVAITREKFKNSIEVRSQLVWGRMLTWQLDRC